MDWPEFTDRLGAVLTGLAGRRQSTALIIADCSEPSCFVQYSCGGDAAGIWAETAADRFRPAHRRLSQEDEQRLHADGWDRPGRRWWSPRPGLPNWSCDRYAQPDADYRGLAQMTVTVLRDIMRIDSPPGLAYEAFDHETGVPIDLDDLGLVRRPA